MTGEQETTTRMATLLRNEEIRLNYRVDGSGETAWLLFNGASLPLEFWDPVAEQLSAQDRVVRFDARDAGETLARGSFSLLDTAADAAAILDEVGVDQVIVAGHAWGGRVAQVFARDYPHRCRGMVICGTGGQLPAKVPPAVMNALRDAARNGQRDAWGRALIQAYCAPGYEERDPASCKQLADLVWSKQRKREARWDPRVAPSASYWGTAQLPALLVYGSEDLNGTPENAADLANRLDDVQLISISGAGHFVIREAEEAVTAALQNFRDLLSAR